MRDNDQAWRGCPFCDSQNCRGVDGMLPEFDRTEVRFFVECLDCEEMWYEVYGQDRRETVDLNEIRSKKGYELK